MNTQERDMLNAFLTQLTQAQVGAKEPEADTLIAQALAKQPNAGYLLVQRAMQLDFVLQQTQAKVAELQAQLERQKPAAQASFLNDVHAWGRGPSATPAGQNPVSAAAAGPAGSPSRGDSCATQGRSLGRRWVPQAFCTAGRRRLRRWRQGRRRRGVLPPPVAGRCASSRLSRWQRSRPT